MIQTKVYLHRMGSKPGLLKLKSHLAIWLKYKVTFSEGRGLRSSISSKTQGNTNVFDSWTYFEQQDNSSYLSKFKVKRNA
jgi:hypothetical protein